MDPVGPFVATEGALPRSPCVRICTIGEDGETCIGCGRTIHEIGRWSRMDAEERTAVLARVAARPPR